jgi:hypothetical protein
MGLDMFIAQVIFDVISMLGLIVSLAMSFKAIDMIKQETSKDRESKPKKILVPGRGIFTQPKEKKTPKYHSETDIWLKEQDEKRNQVR